MRTGPRSTSEGEQVGSKEARAGNSVTDKEDASPGSHPKNKFD